MNLIVFRDTATGKQTAVNLDQVVAADYVEIEPARLVLHMAVPGATRTNMIGMVWEMQPHTITLHGQAAVDAWNQLTTGEDHAD